MLKTWSVFLALLVMGTVGHPQSTGQRYGVAATSATTGNGEVSTESASSAAGSSVANRDINLLRRLGISDYQILPGDIYAIVISQYIGTTGETQQVQLEIVLETDYTLEIPNVGPIQASDMSFQELRRHVITAVKASQPVQYVNLALTAPALFDVFVSGGVTQAGYVMVDGFTRLSDAIGLAHGAIADASLRQIRFTRDGDERVVDLSVFIETMDAEQNPLLRPGDKILVPYADVLVDVRGEVRFPGRYEMLPAETLRDLVRFAGGLCPGALADSIQVARVDDQGRYALITLDLQADGELVLRHDDVVTIRSQIENAPMVVVDGAVYGHAVSADDPTAIPVSKVTTLLPYTAGLTVLSALEVMGGPTPYALAAESYVLRADGEKSRIDVGALWESRDPQADMPLRPGDMLFVPLRIMNVAVTGEVGRASLQPYTRGLTVADYIRSAGGINQKRGTLRVIYLANEDGSHRRSGLDEEPLPGDTIIVDKNGLTKVGDFFANNVFAITGLVAAVLAIVNTVWDFVDRVNP